MRLRVESGPNAGQLFTLTETGTTIGRQDGNTIVLDDGRLSRQHARIDLGPGGLSLIDLGSANGTRVNGQRVSGVQPLRDGDTIQMGETTIIVEGPPAQRTSGPPAQRDSGATALVGPPQGATTPLPPRPASAPQLVRQSDGRAFPLTRPASIIGRQPDNAIVIEDVQSSRQHARFDLDGGQLVVTDLGSANGTRVNGARIGGPTPLRDGDQIQIGTSEYRVEGVGGGMAADQGTTAQGGHEVTVFGGPPPGLGGAGSIPPGGPGTAPLPPMSNPPPPQFAPPGQPWPVPGSQYGQPAQFGPQPQYGAPPQFGAPPPQPGAPPGQLNAPPPGARRRSGAPLLIGGVLVLFLLLCAGIGVGGFLLYRSRSGVTPTVTAGGTSVVGAAATPTATASRVAFPGGGGAPPFPGGVGSPTAPTVGSTPAALPTIAPTATVAASPTLRPTVTPAPTRAIFTPTPSQVAAVPPRTTPSTVAGGGGGGNFSVDNVGLRFTLPDGWTQDRNEAGRATFFSPDRRALITVRWSAQVPTGLTAQQIVQDELTLTAANDPSFVPTNVRVGNVTFGGQPGYGTESYTYTLQNGPRTTEADRAVVLSGQAQYFFGFAALESEYPRYTSIFDGIIATVAITGPQR